MAEHDIRGVSEYPLSHKGVSLEQFVSEYASRSNRTVSEILKWRMPLPCTCDEQDCVGWQMVTSSYLANVIGDYAAWPRGEKNAEEGR